jgi:hypothetical protein
MHCQAGSCLRSAWFAIISGSGVSGDQSSPRSSIGAGSRIDAPAIDYVVADGVLYTDLDEAYLEYSTDALEPNKWTPLFAQAVIRTLAARIYRPILGEKADTREWLVKQQTAQTSR